MQMTYTCVVECTFVTHNFAPDCHGADKRGLTVYVKQDKLGGEVKYH